MSELTTELSRQISRFRGSRPRIPLGVAFLLGSVLLLSCQAAQPVATPKSTEKPVAPTTAAVTPTKSAEKAAEKTVRGGTLRVVQKTVTASFDANVWGLDVNSLTSDTLIQQDENLNPTKEGLIKDWTISGDGKAITFKLREGVKFHDGTDFDAAAVKFNIERISNPDLKSQYRGFYDSVASVEVVDSLTVRFQLKEPDALLVPKLTQPGARMVSPAAVKKYGQDYSRNPVGTGPFQFVQWVPGDHVTLKRFEGYWGKDQAGNKQPYLDQVIFQNIEDDTVAVANLRTGQSDLHYGFPASQLSILKADPNLAYAIRPLGFVWGVYLNTKRPPFDNKALRQAVALALDRDGIAGLSGEGATAHASYFHPGNTEWGADPKAGVFPSRDLAKARAKMSEAGYPSGGLKVKLLTDNSVKSVREAEVLKANLAEIGMEVEIEAVASATATSMVRQAQNYQMTLASTQAGLKDPGYFARAVVHSQGTYNWYGPYNNPKVDEAIDRAGRSQDQKERVALYNEVARIVADDMPFIHLYVPNSIAGMNKKARGYVQYSMGSELSSIRQVWLAQ